MAVPVGCRASKRCGRPEAFDNERLLPGILDDITLNLIAPKLSWADCHRLSAVSHSWRDVVRSGEVQAARVHQCATETLVLLSYTLSTLSREMLLYSIRDNRCYKLPSLPCLDGKIPPTSQCISLDGKVYVLGGDFLNTGLGELDLGNNHGVYVLDPAVGRQWKLCARMIEPKVHFGCGIFNGKLYVLGGLGIRRPTISSEVYDPKEDTWSPIKALPDSLRLDPQVASVGAKLLVHGGKVLQQTNQAWPIWYGYHFGNVLVNRESKAYHVRNVLSPAVAWQVFKRVYFEAQKGKALQVYDAVKDEWSVVGAVLGRKEDVSFMHKGKLHVIDNDDIHVQDTETDSWIHLHEHSFLGQGFMDSHWIAGQVAMTVDDRLLIIAEGFGDYEGVGKARLLRSSRLGSVEKKIQWEKTPFVVQFDEQGCESSIYSMHPIQL